ncbi:MAG: hypothetical protein AAF998_25435 [Bacteroidota bacterium]
MKKTLNLLLIFWLAFAWTAHAQTEAAGPSSYAGEPLYEAAFDSIRGMLDGTRPLSFKRAVFHTENAYLEGRLDWNSFDLSIRNLSQFTELIRKSRRLLYTGPDSLEVQKNAAIFSILKDSIPLLIGNDTVWLEPMQYDFSDFNGRLDWSQMFVSKLLETGKGNCHSLPFLYKILADETGAKAWLSMAPNHTYIKARTEKDGWYNTELTSGYFPNDAWIMASGYIHLDAIRNSLYMDTLSDREAIAAVLVDLAQGYERKYGTGDGNFILRACDEALKAYPEFANALLMKTETERQLLFKRHGLTFGAAEIPPSLRSDSAFQTLTDQYGHINRMGYRRMPDAMYLDWLVSLKKESGTFDDKDVIRYRPPPNYKANNPFKDLGYETEVLTLSQGKYIEDFDLDSLERIGAAVYNWQTGRIAGFVLTDTIYSEYSLEPEIISRWLSPDPLADEFPSWSPYNYTMNNPVNLIDPDGQAPVLPPGPGYAQSHPVSKAIIAYNPNIWRAFHGSNNTSTIHFHQHAKGLAGPDARGKAIGAIGEGLFASRLTSHPSETKSELFIGADVGGFHHDSYQRTYLYTFAAGRFELKVNHTDIYGNSRGSKVETSRSGWISQGTISYEVKTLSANSDPSFILAQFLSGVSQVTARTKAADAGVLVFDQDAWNTVYNSPLRGDLMSAYNELTELRNSQGNQVGFLRLEQGLYDDANKSYHALKDRIKGL